jgi:hypothetical protein
VTAPPQVALLGMMTKIPVAGVVWQTTHYLLDALRIVECFTHDELVERGARNRQLYESQIRPCRARDEMQAALSRVRRIPDDEVTDRLSRLLAGAGDDGRNGR